MSKEQIDWKKKYKEAAMELERLENSREGELLKLAISQLMIGLQGQSPDLDKALVLLRSSLHDEKAPISRKILTPVERSIRSLDASRESSSKALLGVLHRWLLSIKKALGVDSPLRDRLLELERSVAGASESLYQLPGFISQLVELQSELIATGQTPAEGSEVSGGDASVQLEMIADELLQLIGVLNLTTDGRRAADDLSRKIDKGISIADLAPILTRICELIQQATDASQEDFESYLLNLNSQLAEVQGFLQESHSEQQVSSIAHRELDLQVRADVGQIHQAVEDSNDLSELKVSVSRQLAGIVKAMDHFKQGEEQRDNRLQKRYDDLMAHVTEMEEETRRVKAHMEEERQKARTDALTGLPNRAAYDDHMAKEFERWSRYQQSFSVAIGDLDFFKKVNDTYGHLAGDKVLKLVARVLSKNLRTSDFIARFGGEEFVVLMPSTTAEEGARAIDKLRASISKSPFNFHGKPVTITMSFGITQTQDADTPDDLFGRADKALYEAKQKGRDRVCIA